jgi:hypothetical protein
MVNRYGRNYELGLVTRFNLKTGWKRFWQMAPLGWRMFTHGRLTFRPRRIKGLEQIRKIISQAEREALPVEREVPEYASPVGYGAVVEVTKESNRARGGA